MLVSYDMQQKLAWQCQHLWHCFSCCDSDAIYNYCAYMFLCL
jgi:hypothetical protein